MATIKFQLQSKSESAPIYLRLSLGRGQSVKRKTGLTINPKEWSKATGRPKQTTSNNKNLSSKLENLSTAIYDRVNNASSKGATITGEWLKHQIDIHFERTNESKKSELVVDAIQSVIDRANTRNNGKKDIGLSESRVNAYKSLKRVFEFYQIEKKEIFKVKSIGVSFANDFLDYLKDVQNYSNGTALKFVSDLKTVCLDAEVNEIATHKTLSSISAPNPKSKNVIYLNPSELDKIANSDKITREALQNARKWLLLGCNIGQRGGDLLNINENNFVTRNGYEVIELTQQKTGKNVTIPVLETTKEILKNGLPYKISMPKLNEYLKDVCELAEINEMTEGGIIEVTEEGKGNKQKRKVYGKYPKHKLITSHVCRRSFATNNYGVLPTPLIMQITAHGTEKTFLNYIGKDRLDYAQQIADFYALQALKNKKEPQLTILKKAN